MAQAVVTTDIIDEAAKVLDILSDHANPGERPREAMERILTERAQLRNANASPAEQPAPIEGGPRRERLPDTRRSLTHKFDIQGYEGYLTVGFFPDGRPGELFITMTKEGSTVGGMMDTIGTLVSMGLQYGVPLEVYVSKFVGTTYEPRGFTPNPDIPIARSVTDYVFRWMGMEFIPGYREKYAPRRDAADDSPPAGPVARPASGTLQPLISHGLSCPCGGLLVPNGAHCWVCSVCATPTGGCG